jgi:hypothetical protein
MTVSVSLGLDPEAGNLLRRTAIVITEEQTRI